MSLTVKATTGFCPAVVLVTFVMVTIDARDQRIRVLRVSGRRVIGHHVRAHDGGIEGRLALRDMAVGALLVIGLESTGVVRAGSEIDVVVAGAAGGAGWIRQELFGLVAPVVWLWQTSQRRGSAGSTTVEKSLTEFM